MIQIHFDEVKLIYLCSTLPEKQQDLENCMNLMRPVSWEFFSNHRFWNYGTEKWLDHYGFSTDYLSYNTVRIAQAIEAAVC